MIEGINWEQLVAQRREWVLTNFPPDENYESSLLGVIEETGELAHHHLKEEQGIRGDAEMHQAEAKDAIGDITVYLLGVMYHIGIVPVHRPSRVPIHEGWALKHLANDVGQLCLNPCQYYCERIVQVLNAYCEMRGWDYADIVNETWAKVSKRNWIADPVAGGE